MPIDNRLGRDIELMLRKMRITVARCLKKQLP